MVERKPAYSVNFDPELHRKLSGNVRAEMARNKITISKLAMSMGKGKTTISLWLQRNTTQIRHDAMIAAIKRIDSEEGQ